MSDSLFRPLVTKLKPCVSIATPVLWICSSTYLQSNTCMAYCLSFNGSHCLAQEAIWVHGCSVCFHVCILAYQLTKLLFPAEWFPINITVIFFLGGSKVTPTVWAIVINPTEQRNEWLDKLDRKESVSILVNVCVCVWHSKITAKDENFIQSKLLYFLLLGVHSNELNRKCNDCTVIKTNRWNVFCPLKCILYIPTGILAHRLSLAPPTHA